MKVALCFSGQPRFVNECSDLIINNAIQNYDIDVFAHLWYDDDLKNKPYKHGGDGGWEKQRISNNAVDDFIKLYNPKDILVEPSKFFGCCPLTLCSIFGGQKIFCEPGIVLSYMIAHMKELIELSKMSYRSLKSIEEKSNKSSTTCVDEALSNSVGQ